jgi:hypothetical protein
MSQPRWSDSSSSDNVEAATMASNHSCGTGSTAAEIATGARRLALELQEFIRTTLGGSENDISRTRTIVEAEQDENIVDLQLATCRKLREVGWLE